MSDAIETPLPLIGQMESETKQHVIADVETKKETLVDGQCFQEMHINEIGPMHSSVLGMEGDFQAERVTPRRLADTERYQMLSRLMPSACERLIHKMSEVNCGPQQLKPEACVGMPNESNADMLSVTSSTSSSNCGTLPRNYCREELVQIGDTVAKENWCNDWERSVENEKLANILRTLNIYNDSYKRSHNWPVNQNV